MQLRKFLHRGVFAEIALVTIVLGACSHSLQPRASTSGEHVSTASPMRVSMNSRMTTTPVPILMYHYVEPHDDAKEPHAAGLFVSPDIFEEQLQWIVAHGYQTIDLDTYLQLRSHAINEPKKPVILTFDDGYADAFQNALPILQKYHLRGVFYIVSGFLGKPGYLTDNQVIALRDAGMMIAGHTVSHVDLRSLSAKELRHQLEGSRKELETFIGAPVIHFAYPSGRYNQRVIDMVAMLGYKTAVTTHHGIAGTRDPLFQLPRVRMTKTTNLAALLP
ncbi:polysaccharide deacetylase family protein [Candidatus Peregrinibacteria bacterium]|nr:polysaccharide deacetylase family protein [Candidatus Peregrinibacteria bacterium]